MTRINVFRTIQSPREFIAWGKTQQISTNIIPSNILGNVNALIFGAVLLACSITIGCSNDKPKQVSKSAEIPMTQAPSPIAPMSTPAPVMQAENKPAPKKVVRKKPATVNYTDKNYGVTFEYSRRYAIETGDAATDLLTSSSPIPMNFVQPGGVALAAVELPETGYANTDFSSAFFDVSVHKNLTADQCNEFAVPQPKVMAASTAPVAATSSENASNPTTSTEATSNKTGSSTEAQSAPVAGTTTASSDVKPNSDQQSDTKASNEQASASSSSTASEGQGSKLMVGDLELHATEAVSGEGTRQSDAKYFHVYRNGACYEFAVNVTTVASEDSMTKHVDRDKVFATLEKILATVKIDETKPTPDAAPEVSAAAPAAPTTQENPAQ